MQRKPDSGAIRCVLFDLDGTLVDTAPDMVGACNELRAEEGMAPLPFDQLRNYVSKGAVGVLGAAFPAGGEDERERRHQRFLQLYAARLTRDSRPFRGIEPVLDAIEASGRTWGIVTNKPGWLTRPLLESLSLLERAAVVVAGDSLARKKPHPMPLHHAADRCGVSQANCLYVGDDERDVIAGNGAGMLTGIALWGYILSKENPKGWGADFLYRGPHEVVQSLETVP